MIISCRDDMVLYYGQIDVLGCYILCSCMQTYIIWSCLLTCNASGEQLWNKAYIVQGIIDMNRNGNSANFFSYVCDGKKIEELFASTLDRIPISVKCVSSWIVVLNAKFTRLFAVHANKKYGENRRRPTTAPCFASRNTLTFDFHRSFHCAHKNESIIHFLTIYAS